MFFLITPFNYLAPKVENYNKHLTFISDEELKEWFLKGSHPSHILLLEGRQVTCH